MYKSIDVRRWHREERLRAGQQFSWSRISGGEPSGTINVRAEGDAVVLSFWARSFLAVGWKSIEQRLPITWTRCHFGGRRPWFICSARINGQHCGRRVAVLYAAGESVLREFVLGGVTRSMLRTMTAPVLMSH